MSKIFNFYKQYRLGIIFVFIYLLIVVFISLDFILKFSGRGESNAAGWLIVFSLVPLHILLEVFHVKFYTVDLIKLYILIPLYSVYGLILFVIGVWLERVKKKTNDIYKYKC